MVEVAAGCMDVTAVVWTSLAVAKVAVLVLSEAVVVAGVLLGCLAVGARPPAAVGVPH